MSISIALIEELEEIQRQVCRYYKIDLADMVGPRRPNSIAHPRMLAMYLVRSRTDLSLEEIGSRFGRRNHATVIHAYRQITKALQQNPNLHDVIRRILTGVDKDQMRLKL